MSKPIIQLFAPANPVRKEIEALGYGDTRDLVRGVQNLVGPAYRVRAKPSLLEAEVDETRGGRRDDAARIRELNTLLADDDVRALVAIRGGAWLVRLLPHVDFSLLDRRRAPLAVFGFSEITPLSNLIGCHRKGYGYYYMTPGFPRIALARWGRLNIKRIAGRELTGRAAERFAVKWALAQLSDKFAEYWRDVCAILEGRAPRRAVKGRLVAGRLPARSEGTIIGGCMSLVTALTVGDFARPLKPRGKWIALEDLEEHPHRIDRQIAHLKIAGWFDRCAGVLIGDYHLGDEDQRDQVLEILRYHLPRGRSIPVVSTPDFGHTWPQAVLPIGRRVVFACSQSGRGKPRVTIECPWSDWRLV
jgi:muramoyltetrapeptide carboxypeptidase LdcA involved in peptidoglycan recycling